MVPSHPSRVRGLKLGVEEEYKKAVEVAPFTGAWIEMCYQGLLHYYCFVAPFTGAWIEMTFFQWLRPISVPVAPFMGAWIEIGYPIACIFYGHVAPFAGAWIERLSCLSSERPFYWHQNLFDVVKGTWDRIYLYRQYFKSSNPILHRVPHSQPGRCGLFLCGNRVRRPVSRPGRRRGRFCRVWLP